MNLGRIMMRWKKSVALAICVVAAGAWTVFAQSQSGTRKSDGDGLPSGIVWYGKLEDGLNAARLSERPILLLSAAPQCAGVPGMW